MIEIENLTMSYGELLAVDGLDLKVEAGEFFAFLGPNGAGKTTTIKTLTGLLKPTAGLAKIDGHDIQRDPVAAKAVMGFVPDVAVFYDKLTPFEFMEFIGDIFDVNQALARSNTQSLFEKLDLHRYAHQQIETLSHGTRQRLAIAAALMHDPKVFIIDEPMVGLDPLHALAVKKELKARSENGTTIFMSTHLLNIAEELADRIGIIDNGKLVAHGTFKELQDQMDQGTGKALENIFLELFERCESECSD
ncbi:MAG: ABC-2 type transport system ATP-binding protein [Verrucomicrobiales bacterium]|jgi:ABC-2 type transport system ATP-binding protein